jgi:iron complex outermembrane receptor protein
MMKNRIKLSVTAAAALLAAPSFAQEPVRTLDEVVVSAPGGAQGIVLSPTETTIRTDEFTSADVPATVDELLKRRTIVDFRAQSDLVPDDDTITLRGFSSNRFVTAIDSLTVQKTGGRKSSHIVDFALLPTFLVDRIDILPGPHSAIYDAKSIGGVLNMVTKKPKRHDSRKPDVSLRASYGSYNTQKHQATVEGAMEDFTYDLAYQKNATDGYLRHSEADIDTIFTRLGYLLPADGFVTVSGSYTRADRDTAVKNPGKSLDGGRNYDSSYPIYEDASFDPWEEPTWDKEAHALRLNADQPSAYGHLTLNAYTSKEDRDRAYYVKEEGKGIVYAPWVTEWQQQGGRLQDEYRWNPEHSTTFGTDLALLYDNGLADDDKAERVNKKGLYVQHQWAILPDLDLRLGARYEDVSTTVSNGSAKSPHIPGRELEIERSWDDLIPKSFLTWKMDRLNPCLRDTSLSLGVSKIWHAPDYHGDYNPQGRPAGAWLEPEHGMGYDLVFMRRLWRNIDLKANYSFYAIEDYIATNSSFAKYGSSKAGALAYSDYKINLEEMRRHGLELELDGRLTDKLSFYLTYAWQNFDNQGGEPAGEKAQDSQAENRLTAGLRCKLFDKTTLLLDYSYQGDETVEVAEEIKPDVWTFHETENPSYSVFNLGLRHVLLENSHNLKDLTLGLHVNNVLDEEYWETKGAPATDRTFGVTLSTHF